ncbi:hypothetical protein ACG3SL_08240 [Sphingomonas sp. CJ20]
MQKFRGGGEFRINIEIAARIRWKRCFSRSLCKGRNSIERVFCILKGCRRFVACCDSDDTVFLGSVHLVASVMWFCEYQPNRAAADRSGMG